VLVAEDRPWSPMSLGTEMMTFFAHFRKRTKELRPVLLLEMFENVDEKGQIVVALELVGDDVQGVAHEHLVINVLCIGVRYCGNISMPSILR